MLQLIQNLVLAGYTASQVLNFLSSKVKGISQGISQAREGGSSDDEILHFLSGKIKPKNQKKFDESSNDYDQYLSKIGLKTKGERDETKNKFLKGALGLGALGLGALGRGLSQNSVSQSIQPSLTPTQPVNTPLSPSGFPMRQNPIQPGPNIGQGIQQQSQAPIAGAMQPTQPPQTAQAANAIPSTPKFPTLQPGQAKSILDQFDLSKNAQNLLETGSPTEDVAGILNSFLKGPNRVKFGEMLKSGQVPPLQQIVEQFAKEINQGKTSPTDLEPQQIQQPEQLVNQPMQSQPLPEPVQQPEPIAPEPQPEPMQEPEQPKPIAKAETVLTPDGVGEVKAISGDHAIVDVNGKAKKVPLDQIESEPEEVKNATIDFDINSIPEDLRSAPLNEVYTPSDRRHVTVKYNQGLKPIRYIYYRKDGKPVPEEYIAKIREGVQLPITSGLSFWGAWDADKADSRGAANYEELVRNSQEEGKPDDPTKHYWFVKEEGIYEHPYMEKLGKEELRRREAEFNEREKERKRKEKPPKPVKEKKPKKPRS